MAARSSPSWRSRRGMHGDDEHVGGGEQVDPDRSAAVVALEVDDDAALAAVVVPEGEAAIGVGLIVDVRADVPRGRALGRLDLDHLGAEVDELQPGHLAAGIVGQLDDLEASVWRCGWIVAGSWTGAATQITPRSVRSAISSALETQDRAVDVVVVLTEQRCRAPVVGCELGGGERHALEPGLADHRVIELEEHVAVSHLRIVLVDVLRVLHRAGAHAGCLQEVHQLVTVAPGRERGDLAVEIVLVGNSTVVRGETRSSAAHGGEPSAVVNAAHSSSSNTAIASQRSVALGGVHAVGRDVRMVETVAGGIVVATGSTPVDLDVEKDRTEQLDARLDGRDVDVGAHTAGVAGEDRHHQRRRVVVRGLVVHVRQSPARRFAPRQAADVREAACRLDHRAVAAEVGVRAAVPVPAHPGVDHVGTEVANVFLGESPTLHHARREVLRHDAALGDQPLGELAPLGIAHVQRHAQLVAVAVVEHAALVRVGVWRPRRRRSARDRPCTAADGAAGRAGCGPRCGSPRRRSRRAAAWPPHRRPSSRSR